MLELYSDVTKEERATLASEAVSGLTRKIAVHSRVFAQRIETEFEEIEESLKSLAPQQRQERFDNEIAALAREILDRDDGLPGVNVDEVIKKRGSE